MTKNAARIPALGLTLIFTLVTISPANAAFSDKRDAKSRSKGSLAQEQKVVHLLNRVGFGARPGDVERVRKMGIDKYIDLQLHPDRINDSAVEARLAVFPSLRMSIAEVQEKYPAPNLLARQLGLRDARNNGKPDAGPKLPIVDNPEAMTETQRREYQQQVQAYYRANGLRPPQMLLQELQGQKIIRGVYSERQLQEVMTDFWFNHFNIFWGKNLNRELTTDYEISVIRPNTLGKFRDLLMATAKSPAMLVYLDNFQSSSPDARPPGFRRMQRPGAIGAGPGRPGNRRFANQPGGQNYRRRQLEQEMPRQQSSNPQQMENGQQNPPVRLPQPGNPQGRKPGINENYAREIMELHTLGVDGGYTQKDVQEVARCLTGWTVDRPRQAASFVYRDWMHDNGEKVVLGRKLAAGGGIKDGETVIDILARHPSTAKFISSKLVRRFVSDNPPQSLVDRVAATYTRTDGDIREMLRTIFTSQEFYSKEAYRAKIKSPFELAVSAIRALGADVRQPLQAAQFIARMGQPLYMYQAPTGYPDKAEHWVNTGALLERLNYGLALATNKIRGTAFEVARAVPANEDAGGEKVMSHAIALLLNGDVSEQTRAVLQKQMKEGAPVKGELGEVPRISQGAVSGEMQDSSMEGLPPAVRGQGQRGTGNAERLERRFGLGANVPPPVAMSPADLEKAKVIGLVLGSPEFQRR
jgi:uncharacterized protein (DUF1800 family)